MLRKDTDPHSHTAIFIFSFSTRSSGFAFCLKMPLPPAELASLIHSFRRIGRVPSSEECELSLFETSTLQLTVEFSPLVTEEEPMAGVIFASAFLTA